MPCGNSLDIAAGEYASRETKTGSDLGVQRVELAICGTVCSFVCLRGQLQGRNPRGLSHAQPIFWVKKTSLKRMGSIQGTRVRCGPDILRACLVVSLAKRSP